MGTGIHTGLGMAEHGPRFTTREWQVGAADAYGIESLEMTPDIETARAACRLANAAPALLAALRECRRQLAWTGQQHQFMSIESAIETADAAIARAEGGK
jgi:hypothetical protein